MTIPTSIVELPLQKRAEIALKAAVKKAIAEHALRGEPIYIWKDDHVVEVPPAQILAELNTANDE
ncbi:MAG TPA: hypothetical protein VJW93_11445 [Candidatus Acidoferrales bacterium]|nr:hypothetical protein [Candidatus Acidoferrales bacterium]